MGSLLLLAVADVSVDGERLESKGVAPLIVVPFDIRCSEGKDPACAIGLLAKTVCD
jgi:carboxyl-terminal processing protease